VEAHRLAEARSLAYHAWIASRLSVEPEILTNARRRIDRWRSDGSVHPHYVAGWAEVLALPLDALRAWLVDESEQGRALRQVSPFAGAIDPRMRWRIWAEVRDRSHA
jgi:hypothetical protein